MDDRTVIDYTRTQPITPTSNASTAAKPVVRKSRRSFAFLFSLRSVFGSGFTVVRKSRGSAGRVRGAGAGARNQASAGERDACSGRATRVHYAG
jgi:hypothetical protein